MGSAIAITWSIRRSKFFGTALLIFVMAWSGVRSAGYLHGFVVDANHRGSRTIAAGHLHQTFDTTGEAAIAVVSEPAPYNCPPMDFGATHVVLYYLDPNHRVLDRARSWMAHRVTAKSDAPPVLVATVDDPDRFLDRLKLPETAHAKVCEASRPQWLPRGAMSWANKPIVIIESSPH